MSHNGPAEMPEVGLVMLDQQTKSFDAAPAEVRIGAVRLGGWQVHPVVPLPPSYAQYDGYVVKINYDLEIEPGIPVPSWFEVGFAFSDAQIVDALPRTVLDPQPATSYELNNYLHFVPNDTAGRPENVHLPAVGPVVDLFGVGRPQVRWRRTQGVRPGSYVSWMMVLVPKGDEKLVASMTARYDISAEETLGFRPGSHPAHFSVDLPAIHQGLPGIAPIAHLDQRTELVNPVTPRVFIVYAHDNPAHMARVQAFAEFLCGCGIDTYIDHWAGVDRQDWNLWAVGEITQADYVLVIASPQCRAVGDGQVAGDVNRGLQSEMSVLRDRLTDDRATWTRKILPVILPGGSVDELPLTLGPRNVDHYYIESFTVSGSETLLRAITRRPRFERPVVAAKVIHLAPETSVGG